MANIFTRLFNRKEEPKPQEERSLFSGLGLGYNNISSYQTTQAMRLSAVYAATNMISNSCALLPMKIVRYTGDKKEYVAHPLVDLLNLRPDEKHNHFNWMKLLIESVILRGNGYAFIERDSRLNVKAIRPINPDFVTPMLQDDGTVKYIVAGMDSAVDSVNMIHLYQHVDEMYNGISTIKYADMCLRGYYDTETHADQFFKSGAGLMGVLKASAPLTDNQKRQIAESWEKSISRTAGGGVAILPQGLDFQPISVSPEDAQLLEARQYNVVEIARFFNISPIKLFDFSHISYSTLEQTTLSYLQDTILPFTQLIEDEFNKKVFKPSEIGKLYVDFDFSVLMSADKKTEAEYYRTLITNSVLSPNEVREKLGYTPIEGDAMDSLYMQLSYAAVENIYKGMYVKQNAQTPESDTKNDNKVLQDNKTEE